MGELKFGRYAVPQVLVLIMLFLSSALWTTAQAPNTINTIAGGGANPSSPTAAFLGGPDGVVKDGAGNVYILSAALNEVFKVSAQGQFSVYAGIGVKGFSGDGGPANQATLDYPSGIALDGSENLYIADFYNQRIRRVDASTGVITTYAGSSDQRNGPGFFGGYTGDGGAATSALLNGPSAITFDNHGNLFIADSSNRVVRMVDNSAQHIITTYAGNGKAGTAGTTNGDGGPATSAELNLSSSGDSLATDATGNLYIADYGDYVVRVVDTSASHLITTYAGNPSHLGYSGDGGAATSAGLDQPTGVFVDGNANLFVAFGATGFRVREVGAAAPHLISTVAGTGAQCVTYATGCGDGGTPTNALLDQPLSVFVDSSENLFIADYGSDRVRVASLAPQNPSPVISTFAGGGSDGAGGPATGAILAQPYYLAGDAMGDLFVPEIGAFLVNRIDGSTGVITPYAGNGLQGSTGNGGPATQANTNLGYGIALDGSGNLFFTDGLPYVRRVDAVTKTITAFAGSISGFCAPSVTPGCGDGGPATSATFDVITGIAADSHGNIYIADYVLNRIRRIDAVTGIVTNCAGTGTAGYSGDGGPATSAQLSFPFGIAFDSQDNLYVADLGNNVIRMIDNTADHNITTYAFNGLPTFGGDGGDALSASMQSPLEVAVDAAGNLFVTGADAVVRRIDNGGGSTERSVITVAGDVNNLDGGFSGDGGPSTQAMLSPEGIAVDASHNLYIADGGNNRIRKVHLAPVALPVSLLPTAFGSVFAGTSSSPADVFLENSGLDDLTVTNVSAPAGFSVSNDCSTNSNQALSVSPGGASVCDLIVTFSPAANAAPGTITGNLTFSTNDPANPSYSFPLSGTVAAQPGVALTVSETGTGSGIIYSGTGTIDCPSACSENFPLNAPVILAASANSGSAFTGWTVNGSSTACPGTSTCTVTMSAAENVVATFGSGTIAPPPSLTVAASGNGSGTITSTPAGINCAVTNGATSGTCTFSGFPPTTTTVTLTATATGNSTFAGWLTSLCAALPLSGTAGPCQFYLAYASLIGAPQVTAVFSGPPQTFAPGQIFVGSYGGTIFVYNPNGTLAQVLGSGNLSAPIYGMNFDQAGNLYAASPGASDVPAGTVEFFGNGGSGPTTFGTYPNSSPSDVLVDPSGNVFVGQANGEQLALSEFAGAENGAPTSTFYPASVGTVSGNGEYIDLLDDNESMLYTSGGNRVGNFDILYKGQNPDFADNLPGTGAYQIRELSDKSVLVADTSEIVRLSSAGSVIQTYTPGGSGRFYALALNPDGLSFWTADGASGKVYQVRISDGTILNTISTGLSFAVSGQPTIFGIAVLGQTQSGGADVSVSMTASPSLALAGSGVTYTILVTNHGPASAANVAVTDALPSGVAFLASATSLGACSGTTTVTCALSTMASGQTAAIEIEVTPTQSGTLLNDVNVTSTTPDPNTDNNGAGTSTTVLSAYALQIYPLGTGGGTVTDNLEQINCVDTASVLTGTCTASYASGTVVTLTATPSSGSTFYGWLYPCTGTGTCSVTMTGAQIAEAYFLAGAPQTYTLTLTEVGTGTGTVTDSTGQIDCSEASGVVTGTCSGSYASGTQVVLTENATSPSTFAQWGGACASSGTGTTCGLTVTSNLTASANFVPPPVSVNLTFPVGTNPPPQQAVFNCPSNPNPTPANPCTDPNAYAAQLTLPQVNAPLTLTVTAVEVPPSQADGLCETGNTVLNDFDCRFATFFKYGTDANGNAIVPLCYPYANGNCVHYEVYSGTPGNEPDPSLYSGPVDWQIAFNNDTFVAPGPNWTGSQPQFYDDPDYAPTPTSAVGSVCTQPMTIGGVAQSYACQFEFDITTFVTPGQQVDTVIGGRTKQLNDVVIAFPPTNSGGQLNVRSTPDAATVNAGQGIGYTIVVSNAGPGTENSVTMNDPLPAGVSWTIGPAYGGPGSCTVSGAVGSQVLSCAFGDLANGASASVHVSGGPAGAGTYTNTATVTVGNQQILTIATETVTAETSGFSGLTGSQTIAFGTASINLTGTISGAGGEYPTSSETVSVTIDNVTQTAAIGTNGAFSLTFPTATIPASVTPYTITYSYAGDANLNPTSDSTTTLTVNSVTPTIVVQLASTSPVVISQNGNVYDVALTLTNAGNTTVSNLAITGATLGGTSAPSFPAGNSVTNLAPGATATIQMVFSGSAGAAGASVPFKASGTYAGGSLSGNWSATVRSVKLP